MELPWSRARAGDTTTPSLSEGLNSRVGQGGGRGARFGLRQLLGGLPMVELGRGRDSFGQEGESDFQFPRTIGQALSSPTPKATLQEGCLMPRPLASGVGGGRWHVDTRSGHFSCLCPRYRTSPNRLTVAPRTALGLHLAVTAQRPAPRQVPC